MPKASNTLLLAKLEEKITKDLNLPLKETATNLVFGSGNSDAEIVFIGEAPGRFEDLKGIPFVGQSGKLLDKLLENINLLRDDIYITSIVKYRPPNNRPPTASEIAAFQPFLDKQLKIIQPKVIVTLGRFAMEKFLPDKKISQIHGQPQSLNLFDKPLILLPLYHPAAALRNSNIKKQLESDFQILKNLL